MRNFVIPTSLTFSLFLFACPGDDGGDDGSQMGSSSTTTADTDPATGDGSTSVDPGTTTASETEGEDSTGPGETEGEDTSTGEPVESHWGALVLGELFTDDLMMAQGTHDAVAMGGQADAMAAGDYGHDAMLGTTLLGTTENQFMGIDQWDNLDGAMAVYGNPMFAKAFGMLFGAPPSLELFERRDDWYGWGSLEAADDAGGHWFVVVRGRLASDDLEAMQAMHDGIAMGGEEIASGLGDVAHVVWVGTPEDPQEFFAVDVWNDDTAIETFYGDPMFAEAFGMLFEAPPTIGVYGSTDWHQW